MPFQNFLRASSAYYSSSTKFSTFESTKFRTTAVDLVLEYLSMGSLAVGISFEFREKISDLLDA